MLTTRVRVYMIAVLVAAVVMIVASGVFMVKTVRVAKSVKSTLTEYRSLKPEYRKYLGDKPLLGITVAIETTDVRSAAFYQVLLDQGAQRANKLIADFVVGHDDQQDWITIRDQYGNAMSKRIRTIFFATRYGQEIAKTLGRESVSSKVCVVKRDLSPEEDRLVKIEQAKIKKLDKDAAKMSVEEAMISGGREKLDSDKQILNQEKAGFTSRKTVLEKREAQFTRDQAELDRKRSVLQGKQDDFTRKQTAYARDKALLDKTAGQLEERAKQLARGRTELETAKKELADQKKRFAKNAEKRTP